jgi:hypothetical protein
VVAMAYSEFSLTKVRETFDLILDESQNLFSKVAEVQPSHLLKMVLDEYLSLAIDINSEKARSEFIIAPVLGDIRRQTNYQVSLFSGKEFDVDAERGLTGYCDFILSCSKEQLYIQAPVAIVVEAKNENMIGGMGQCIAGMIAAQLFNQRVQNQIEQIYGAVTTGTNWRFLQLNNKTVWIDKVEYYISDIGKILGIFLEPLQLILTSNASV